MEPQLRPLKQRSLKTFFAPARWVSVFVHLDHLKVSSPFWTNGSGSSSFTKVSMKPGQLVFPCFGGFHFLLPIVCMVSLTTFCPLNILDSTRTRLPLIVNVSALRNIKVGATECSEGEAVSTPLGECNVLRVA